jgi:molybdate transport system ATP-binding protein
LLEVAIKKDLGGFAVDISFCIANRTLALFGPSGCGKTTILRCIAGLIRPEEGRIVLDKKVFFSSESGCFVPPRARNIGYMFQDYALFPHMNVAKNILYGAKESKGRLGELYDGLLELLKITHLTNRYPGKLSGGEKQRVALARALMAEPKLLLLDEPMSSLEQETRRELQGELQKLQQMWQIPFVLVTHDREEANCLADEIIFLENGRRL